MRRDGGRPAEEPSWHDREPVALAAGVAAFVLLGLLALAVIRTSEEATDPAPYLSPAGSTGMTTSSSTIKTLTSTSSYTVPSAQTSEDSGAPVTTPPVAPTEDSDVPDAPPPPTTIFNPYATTTQGNAGHV